MLLYVFIYCCLNERKGHVQRSKYFLDHGLNCFKPAQPAQAAFEGTCVNHSGISSTNSPFEHEPFEV